jgi:ElaB/YqjD/DUF883 family membrane-anchored ribosome-binding protein
MKMSKSPKSDYPEIDEIRQDLDSLKTNIVELTRHVQEQGVEQVHELGAAAQKKVADLKKTGNRELHKLEDQVKAHPGQSMALAFAAGLALSVLMGRRG